MQKNRRGTSRRASLTTSGRQTMSRRMAQDRERINGDEAPSGRRRKEKKRRGFLQAIHSADRYLSLSLSLRLLFSWLIHAAPCETRSTISPAIQMCYFYAHERFATTRSVESLFARLPPVLGCVVQHVLNYESTRSIALNELKRREACKRSFD